MVGKRERISIRDEQRFVRRDAKGRFTSDQTVVGRSVAGDRQRQAKHAASPGQGDRGDRTLRDRRSGPC